MYLKKLTLTNFRKYPRLEVEFKEGLNVLIGENDQGKTSIIDAIKYLLNTKSNEIFRYDIKDFHHDSNTRINNFQIVGMLSGFKDEEAANFIEWGYFNCEGKFELRVQLYVSLKSNNRIVWDFKAGPENTEVQMDGNARELLQVTYLKPLRDAENELTAGNRSRLSQILQSHDAFRANDKSKASAALVEIVRKANAEIIITLDDVKAHSQVDSPSILEQINTYLSAFQHENDNRKAQIKITEPEIHRILRSLGLQIEENTPGLGTLNKLFMAAELLHLETDPYNSLRLCLIEELEAHLHPQAQLRVINTLGNVKNTQFIITTHSTTLGSSIKLENIILCHNDNVYPMWKENTQLSIGDRHFLQRFLDATKANLFFARGVIMVEGDAENILIPVIAEIINLPLHKYGVSVVNVGGTAFSRYAKIFNRMDGKRLDIPVAVITDLDMRAMEYYEDIDNGQRDLPGFYVISKEKFFAGGVEHDLTSIHNTIYTNKDQLRDAIRKAIGGKKMPEGVSALIKNWEKLPIDRTNIKELRSKKKLLLELKQGDPVKVFANDFWTLEYDVALSKDLRIHMAKAVIIAQKVNASEDFFDSLYNEEFKFKIPDDDIQEDILINKAANEWCSTGDDYQIAYRIFKPFVSKNPPSKSVTAQILSDIFKSEVGLKDHIMNDPQIAYLINAIRYACRQDRLGIKNDAEV